MGKGAKRRPPDRDSPDRLEIPFLLPPDRGRSAPRVVAELGFLLALPGGLNFGPTCAAEPWGLGCASPEDADRPGRVVRKTIGISVARARTAPHAVYGRPRKVFTGQKTRRILRAHEWGKQPGFVRREDPVILPAPVAPRIF